MRDAEGAIIAGKYQLIQQIGRGGMATVYRARHIQLDIPVAVKLLHARGDDTDAAARFEREARAAASLRSPHIVQVQDFGIDRGDQYLVMELLEGEPLSKRLKSVERLSLQQADLLLVQIARGLGKAHSAGIIHRDLKPDNIFLASEDGRETVKIVDFGIAKHARSEDGPTDTGDIIGTVEYSSPEQIRGERDLDVRTDLWSVGVILFRALTGKLPFRGTNQTATILSVISDPLPAMAEVSPQLPPALDGFFARALAKNRHQRFASISELSEAFSRLVSAPAAGPTLPVFAARPLPALDPDSITLRRSSAPLAPPASTALASPVLVAPPPSMLAAQAAGDTNTLSPPTFEPQAISVVTKPFPAPAEPLTPPHGLAPRAGDDRGGSVFHRAPLSSAASSSRRAPLLIGAAVSGIAVLSIAAVVLSRRASAPEAPPSSQDAATSNASASASNELLPATSPPAAAPADIAPTPPESGAPGSSPAPVGTATARAAGPALVAPPTPQSLSTTKPGSPSTVATAAAAGQSKPASKTAGAKENPMCNEQTYQAKLNECHANLDVECAQRARAAHAVCASR